MCVRAHARVCAHACTCLGGGECFGQGELPLSRPGGDTECGAGGGTRTRYRAECERELVRIAGREDTDDILSENKTELRPEGCR